jgi:catechol-2,3-dioxygenase
MALPLLSQLAHVELSTPKPQESLEFWRDVIGLEETSVRTSRSTCVAGEIASITRSS